MRTPWLPALALVAVLTGCSAGDDEPGAATPQRADSPGADGSRAADDSPDEPPDEPDGPDPAADGPRDDDAEGEDGAASRPDWLGARVLPETADGYGEVRETPTELVDRRLPPPPAQPRADGDEFAATIGAVPDRVVERSTWRPECPVGLDELRYVTVTFHGFDERAHTGELLVHASIAEDVVGVFEALHEAGFPIEEMRVVAAHELDAPPTGDGNNTTGFVCRESVGGAVWSEHARGLAIDVNPFHNPYLRDELVLPELASAYLDRDHDRPGMIHDGDVVVEAFADIGWGWGGDWSSARDWMHFSATGR